VSKSKEVKPSAKRIGKVSKPATLKPGHDVAAFDCGREPINNWLKTRAKKASENDTARTYVVCRGSKRVIGFYALAAGAVERASAPGRLSRNSPDPIPVIILAMFGVDAREQGQGLGQDLLADAMRRALQAARIIGARALLIHALDAAAAKYYRDRNFAQLSADEETFFVTMKELREALG
jgi:GNAT superfamily N-acetyltransferase